MGTASAFKIICPDLEIVYESFVKWLMHTNWLEPYSTPLNELYQAFRTFGSVGMLRKWKYLS